MSKSRAGRDGVANGSRACQIAGGDSPATRLPWAGDERAEDKTAIFRTVVSAREGTPLSHIVASVFGQSAAEAAGADYQLTRRFVRDCNHVETATRGGLVWVYPATSAFSLLNLSPQYVDDKTAGRAGDGVSDVPNWRETQSGEGDGGPDCRQGDEGPAPRYPKDRAQSTVSRRLVLDDSDGRADCRAGLLRELDVEREIQQDKFSVLSRVRGDGPEHLLIPYETRFNSGSRARDVRRGFRQSLVSAADRHDDAVLLTLTTDPARFNSLDEALGHLSDAKGRFMSWLSTDYQLGHRPANLSVLEFTDGGLPHLHVVLFGLSWLMPQSKIAAKWDDLDHGRVVDVRAARRRGDRWMLHNDDGGTATLRQYLGKAIDGLVDVATAEPGTLTDGDAEGDETADSGPWRQALYWATERQYYSCSPSLKPDSDEGDGLPFVKRYEFVGVSQYRDIPGHVRDSAVMLSRGRPPPD